MSTCLSDRVCRSRCGFSLIELLVVLAVIAVLASLLFPSLGAAYEKSRQAKCASNLRQLFLANVAYAADNGTYVPAAEDICTSVNKKRWHGTRANSNDPFDGRTGPLVKYLGDTASIRTCPSLKQIRTDAAANAFEASCGGYGYNDRGVGSQAYWRGFSKEGTTKGMPPSAIRHPVQTVMFCDTAFPQPYDKPDYLIEYSFAEAFYFVEGYPPQESEQARPSIHFRHLGKANVVWCDGHVSSESMTTSFSAEYDRFKIGWFGGSNNSLFDPF